MRPIMDVDSLNTIYSVLVALRQACEADRFSDFVREIEHTLDKAVNDLADQIDVIESNS